MSGPRLPTEVCEEIISLIDSTSCGGTATLHACALVCHSWLPRSRAQLYRDVRVSGESIRKFLDMVAMNPHLGANVIELVLKESEGSTDIYRFFSDVIPLLTKITSLTYHSVPIPYSHLPLFPSGLVSLTSLHLRGIEADSFGDFIRFVSLHKHLKELTIHECSWKRSSDHHYSFAMRWGRDLQKLSFDRCEYRRVFDILRWLGRSNTSCSIQCLQMDNLGFSEQPVVPVLAEHLATQWSITMKAIYVGFSHGIERAGEAKEALVSSLTAYIRCCPNLHTVRLHIEDETLWVLRQLPGILSSLVFLRRIAFRFWVEADVVFLDDNERTWTAVDKVLGDSAKLWNLEYVEIQCIFGNGEEIPDWCEIDTGSREHGHNGSGSEPDGESGETENREECNSGATESLIGERGRQQQQGIASHLRGTMNGVAYFHHCRKKPLTDIFPRLSASGILWCGIQPYGNGYPYALSITALNLKKMKSPDWHPHYCRSIFEEDLDYD